ncbi:MAG: hypothetical protein LBU02_00735 [Rickettsiales bacterium]|nr:hypothetical protein [Rickettsiales bacterium]
MIDITKKGILLLAFSVILFNDANCMRKPRAAKALTGYETEVQRTSYLRKVSNTTAETLRSEKQQHKEWRARAESLKAYVFDVYCQLEKAKVSLDNVPYENTETALHILELIEELQIAFNDTHGATEGLLTFVRSTLDSLRDERNRLSPIEDPEVYGLFDKLHNKVLEKYNEVRAVVQHNSGQVLPDYAEQ